MTSERQDTTLNLFLTALVASYLKAGRLRHIQLTNRLIEKIGEMRSTGLLTPLRIYLEDARIVKARRSAYIHAHMLSGHISRAEEKIGSGESVDPGSVVFEDALLRHEAEYDWGIFLAEEAAEQAMYG